MQQRITREDTPGLSFQAFLNNQPILRHDQRLLEQDFFIALADMPPLQRQRFGWPATCPEQEFNQWGIELIVLVDLEAGDDSVSLFSAEWVNVLIG